MRYSSGTFTNSHLFLANEARGKSLVVALGRYWVASAEPPWRTQLESATLATTPHADDEGPDENLPLQNT